MTQLPPIDLSGRVALVLGADEVGEAIAGGLGSGGAEVAVAATGTERLARLEARLGVTTFACDFADPVQIGELFASVRERFGRLDVLVCAQSRRPEPRSLLEVGFQDYRATVAHDLDATFLCVQKAAQIMVAGGAGGRIVVVAPLHALAAHRGDAAADIAQAGLRGLIKAAAVDLGPRRITVNGILLGPLRTDLPDERLDAAGETALNPAGLVGEPADAARATLWLADPENAFVTGSLVAVDGAQTALLPLP
ncbi:MAG: SDR family oxidoreductase [Actinobacteria bacterium]|nr:SDR family oxidoreductase [Actinomycetota bacterium]